METDMYCMLEDKISNMCLNQAQQMKMVFMSREMLNNGEINTNTQIDDDLLHRIARMVA